MFYNFNLVVGSVNGEITLWEVGSREKLTSKSFKIWDMSTCSLSFQVRLYRPYLIYVTMHPDVISKTFLIIQASFGKDAPMSVNRVRWSPDGNIIGRYILLFS